MKEIIRSTFRGFNENLHQIRIYDREETETQKLLLPVVSRPGYDLDYDAGITDLVRGRIISSELKAYFQNQGKTNNVLNADFWDYDGDLGELAENTFDSWTLIQETGDAQWYAVDDTPNNEVLNSLKYVQVATGTTLGDHRIEQSIRMPVGVKHNISFWAKKAPGNGLGILKYAGDIFGISTTENWQLFEFEIEGTGNFEALEIGFGLGDCYLANIELSKQVDDIHILDSFLDHLLKNKEGRYLVEVFRDGESFWKGVLLPDFGGETDEYFQRITISATDGYGLLQDVDFDYGASSILSFAGLSIKGLAAMPVVDLFNFNIFCRVRTTWDTDAMDASGTDPLDRAGLVFHQFFFPFIKEKEIETYTGNKVIKTEKSSYYEVLNAICEHFNCFLLQHRGAYAIIQIAELQKVSLETTAFNKVGNIIGSSTLAEIAKEVDGDDIDRISGNTLSYLPGIGKITGTFPVGGDGNLIPPHDISEYKDKFFSTVPVFTGVGNFLDINLFLRYGPYYNTPSVGTHYLEVKIGDFYLQDDGSWATTFNEIFMPGSFQQIPFGFDIIISYQIITSDIPVPEPVSIKIRTVGTTDPVKVVDNKMIFVIENQNPADYVSFVSDNDGFTLDHEIESIFGSSGSSATGAIRVYDGSNWIQTPQEKWRQNTLEAYDQFFNELLVNEIMSGQNRNLKTYHGSIIDRNGSSPLSFINPIRLNIDGDMYRMFMNKVSYNAMDEEWSGDWFEIGRTEVRQTTVDEVPPLPNPFGNYIPPLEEPEGERTLKAHRDADLILDEGETDTWTDVSWDLPISEETTDGIAISELDSSIVIIDDDDDIYGVAGCIHLLWQGAVGTTVKAALRVVASTDEGVTWAEKRCLQNLENESRGGDAQGVMMYNGTINVEQETWVKLQIRFSSEQLILAGDEWFDNAVAGTIHISSKNALNRG